MMKTAILKDLPKFYISKRMYGRRADGTRTVKYVPCRTYTVKEREQYFEEYWNAEYQSTAEAAYFKYLFGRPNAVLDALAY